MQTVHGRARDPETCLSGNLGKSGKRPEIRCKGKGLVAIPGANLTTVPARIALCQPDKGFRHRFFAALQMSGQFVADGVSLTGFQAAQLRILLGCHDENRELPAQSVQCDDSHGHQQHSRDHTDEDVSDDQSIAQAP